MACVQINERSSIAFGENLYAVGAARKLLQWSVVSQPISRHRFRRADRQSIEPLNRHARQAQKKATSRVAFFWCRRQANLIVIQGFRREMEISNPQKNPESLGLS